MQAKKDWFHKWFNTPYYHLLYRDRDDSEAELFMMNLTQFLGLKKDDTILDLPCGKGRHAIFLNSLGFDVTGADLSENSIEYAKQFENCRKKVFEGWFGKITNLPMAKASAVVVHNTSDSEGLKKILC